MYQASGSFEQNTHRVCTDVLVVDDQFATEPMTAVKPTEQQVSEEELYRFFEQAISDRLQALSARLNRVRGPLSYLPHTTGYGWCAGSVEVVLSPHPLRKCGDARMWSSLLSETWQRGIILVSLALLLLMSGFDLMGLLVLHLR